MEIERYASFAERSTELVESRIVRPTGELLAQIELLCDVDPNEEARYSILSEYGLDHADGEAGIVRYHPEGYAPYLVVEDAFPEVFGLATRPELFAEYTPKEGFEVLEAEITAPDRRSYRRARIVLLANGEVFVG